MFDSFRCVLCARLQVNSSETKLFIVKKSNHSYMFRLTQTHLQALHNYVCRQCINRLKSRSQFYVAYTMLICYEQLKWLYWKVTLNFNDISRIMNILGQLAVFLDTLSDVKFLRWFFLLNILKREDVRNTINFFTKIILNLIKT
jgi:hypothetical protein